MIPIPIKRRLVILSQFLSPIHRGSFLRKVVIRLEALSLEYPRTMVFSCAGYVVGKIIDTVTGIPLSLPGLLAGGLFGLHRDLNSDVAEDQIRRVISEEFGQYYEI